VARRGRRTFPGAVTRRALVGLTVLMAGIVLLLPVGRGVTVEGTVGADGVTPLHVYVPDGDAVARPGIVVAHGFAGSARLMHSWSLALAGAGFVVVAPDLPGHGANAAPIAMGPGALAATVDAALEHLVGIPTVDAGRIGLLGHSMGSGAVLERGIRRPELIRSVVAVSPTDASVDALLPRDLLLLAGANEQRFVANAESLLLRAGGERGAAGDGDARRLVIVPRVEHVSILFSRAAQDASIEWFAASLVHAPTGAAPRGPLAGWSLLAVGLLVLWQVVGMSTTTPAVRPARRSGAWLALPVGGVAATASLVIVARSVELADLFGVLVAGEVGLWFLMTGAVWLRFGVRPAPPDPRDVGWALLATGVLVGLGASFSLAWAPWWLSGVRVSTAVLLTLLLLPFSIASAAMLHGRRGWGAVGVWSVCATAVVVTLGAAAVVVPGLGFLVLVLPLLPLVLAATSVVAIGVDRPWATGTAGAVFVGWLLAMLFPLA
jgi:pimeloyl-ACP methyl ester carboxylesterase